jgi:putative FmdB family regulatory protein
VPIFDYRCAGCGREFEAIVRGTDGPLCPGCGGCDLERLPSAFGVSIRSGGLSAAARKAVAKQQRAQHRDQAAFQAEIEKKHLDD